MMSARLRFNPAAAESNASTSSLGTRAVISRTRVFSLTTVCEAVE